jgi:hypothetical protein
MDLGLIEYALWVVIGLWATLFVDNAIARAAGLVLIGLAILRALTEKDAAPRPEVASAAGDATTDSPESPGTPESPETPSPPARQRRRIL